MSDPVTSAALSKAASSAAEAVPGLLTRLLGPSADVLGDALSRWTERRVRNVGRILEKAEEKAEGREGLASPRIAHRLLEEGSFCDDSLMADYFSGVLAASVSPGGADDSGVGWAALIGTMSSLQVRAHFLFYREWALLLTGRSGIELGQTSDRNRTRLVADATDFVRAMTHVSADAVGASVRPGNASAPRVLDVTGMLSHTLTGLHRQGLLDSYGWGDPATLQKSLRVDVTRTSVSGTMTLPGIELFGWAQGVPSMTWRGIFDHDWSQLSHVDVPRLSSARLPKIDSPA